MANSTLWWLLAGAAVALELLSGTVYLLLIGIAFAAAAVSAHLGLALAPQLVVAAVVGVGAVLAWYFVAHRRGSSDTPAAARPDVHLDVGENVQVDAWNADGTATVRHRGAQWTAIVRPGALPVSGLHRVMEIVGSRLVVEKI